MDKQEIIDYLYSFNTHADITIEEMAEDLAIPSADPYKGMTNGEVHDMLYQMLVDLKDGADRYGAEFWWNSPYKPQERNNKE